jgi:ribosomal protein S20
MKSALLMTLIIIISASNVAAEDPPKQILQSGDVQHFIKTFPLLEKEFENYNIEYEAKDGTMTVPDALEASNEFLEILKKHGWDENFFQKTGVILMGYSYIVYGEEMKNVDSEFEKSLKEIDSNPNLSAEMKNQLKEQMKTAKSAMKTQEKTFKQSIHPNDLKMITPHIKEIQKVIDKEYEKESEQ